MPRRTPASSSYASAGVGSGIHLAAEYFRSLAGLEMTHVPYKGSGPALTDLIGGHVSMYFSSMPPAIQLVKEGKIRALGVTGLKRSPIFPELPTIAEAALPGYEAVLHYGIIAPAGTPKPHVAKLNAALRQAGDVRRAEAEARRRRHRAAGLDAGGIRRRHRQGRDQVVRHREKVRRQGRMKTALRFIIAAALAFVAIAAHAADYPARPITLVVPYAAGGGDDVIARIVAEKMSASLGQSIVIENRGGAGGTIATRQVAKSEPDGYTLLIATSSLAINPSLYPNVGYDPRKDFAPIGLIASSANVVMVNNTVPVKSIAELIALAKQKPGELNFASTGTGSSVHLAAELFAGMAGIKINHVPYKGSGPALNDLVGGHVTMMFGTMASAAGPREGRRQGPRAGGDGLEALGAVSRSAHRRGERPAGLRVGAALRHGVAAAGTPRPIVDKLNAALNTALASEDVKQRLAVEGARSACRSVPTNTPPISRPKRQNGRRSSASRA